MQIHITGSSDLFHRAFARDVSSCFSTSVDTGSTSSGAEPQAGLTLSADGSTLYGTTTGSGASSDGTVFSVPVPTPEPGSAVLLVTGFLAVSLRRVRLRLKP